MTEQHIDIFPWHDSFNTGVEEVDLQHRHLVKLLNKIASSISLGSTIDAYNIMKELVEYTKYHFETEERYWLSSLADIQQTKQHQEAHNQFIICVSDLKDKMEQEPEEQWIEETLSFLTRWLASHILESDRFMAFLSYAMQTAASYEEAVRWANEQMQGSTRAVINVILAAYESLTANTLRLMREIKSGHNTLAQLQDSENRLREAMDYAKIGHWDLPYSRTGVYWSPQMYEIFGVPPESKPGPEFLCNIMADSYHQSFFDSLDNSFSSGQEHKVEYPITRPSDGETRWIECRGRVVYNSDGSPKKLSGFIQDITDHKENEQQIVQLAYYDPLTGLPNRRLLFDRLAQSLNNSIRSEQSNALLYMDLDNFKALNDSHGHDYGDDLLRQVTARIEDCIRQCDTLARIGGDEFVILLSGLSDSNLTAAAQSEIIANKILATIATPYYLEELQYNCTASIGIVLFKDDSLPASDLMKHADIAMYQAKQDGKNTCCFFDPEMQKDIANRVSLEGELRRAIGAEEFELYYQPQVDQLNQITGVEALLRWVHPTLGTVSPAEFIPIAEETGLILPIGHWVLQTACMQLRDWQTHPETAHLSLSVNVSYKQFRQPRFASDIKNLLLQYGVTDASKLKIELTESLLFEDLELTLSHMHKLRRLDIQFSLDDFGTGYSSLQYLKKLPLNQLKIDRSFVRDIETDSSDQAIVQTIISIGKSLNIEVIAEGVESLAQQQFLETHGCHLYQGFFFGKPTPIDEFRELISSLPQYKSA